MTDVPRITAEDARREAAAGRALLVCAYADEAKCNAMRLEGSLTLAQLGPRLPSLPKDQPLVYYCA